MTVIITMTVEEQIAELKAEVAHADDLVERLMTENEELHLQVDLLRRQRAEQLVPA